MAAFFRGLLLFLVGAIVGAGGVLFFTPSFHVVVSRSPAAAQPIEVAASPAPLVAPVVPAAPKAAASVAIPAPSAVAVAPAPAAPAAPAAAEPTIDFKSISEHLILWPNSVTVKTATTVPVMADGKKVQDLSLDVGTLLQVSKVLADGSLEARAKGAKFEIKSTLTDFSVELGKRVSELVAKGVKIDSPFAPAAVVAPVTAPVAMTPAVTTPTAPVAVVAPKGPLTLAQRVDVLFGNKPDAVIPAAPVAPVTSAPAAAPAATIAPAAAAPAAPVAEIAPAAEPKAVEKGKDLDRKMNQLFK
jgi:2-oxoglutarate dehydrogenase E2 component (dihydrolipoamide succinyltransferase)